MIRFTVLLAFAFVVLASLRAAAPAFAAPKGVTVQQPTVDMPLSDTARKHYRAGIAYVDDPSGPKWDEAYREFLAAYADAPTWRLQNNIGLCALNLERDAEAIAAYTAYLLGGGEPYLKPRERKQIETDIATLSASLVEVEIRSEPADVTIVDERKNAAGALVVNNYKVMGGKASLGLHPGRHKITSEAPGFVPEEWVIDAAPATTHTHEFKLMRRGRTGSTAPTGAVAVDGSAAATGSSGSNGSGSPSASGPVAGASHSSYGTSFATDSATSQRHKQTAVYVIGTAAGVLALAATVTGIVALSKQKDYRNAPDAIEADRLARSGGTWALVTDIEIGAAILSAGVAAYLHLSADNKSSSVSQSQQRFATKLTESSSHARWRLTPNVYRNSGGISVIGNF